MNALRYAVELLAIGMGGIFIVMFLLFVISQGLLKLTTPKTDDSERA